MVPSRSSLTTRWADFKRISIRSCLLRGFFVPLLFESLAVCRYFHRRFTAAVLLQIEGFRSFMLVNFFLSLSICIFPQFFCFFTSCLLA